MGTRGCVAFQHEGEIVGWYNHFDSYPDGLGADVLDKIKQHDNETLLKALQSINFINQNDDDAEDFYENHKVIFEMDWVKELIGSYKQFTLQDGTSFLKDGLFCEWAYIFNFDEGTLEVRSGFARFPDEKHPDWFYEPNYDSETFYTNELANFPLEALRSDKWSEEDFVKTLETLGNNMRDEDEKRLKEEPEETNVIDISEATH